MLVIVNNTLEDLYFGDLRPSFVDYNENPQFARAVLAMEDAEKIW